MNKNLKLIVESISSNALMGRWGITELAPPPLPPPTEEDPKKTGKAPPAPGDPAPAPTEAPAPETPPADAPPAPETPPTENPVDTQNAEKEAEEAKEKLDKAKDEKEKAEKEIENVSSIRLTSKSGVSFLLGKILDNALKTNKLDSLANEFSTSLKIDSPEGFENFRNNTIQFTNLKGYPKLLDAIKSLISK